jgi:tetratricopeptide (TPR) repeat protein
MANSPPARRRPSTSAGSPPSGGAGSQRPGRKTGAAAAVRAEPLPFNGPKLVVTAGPKEGEEFNLDGDEYVIGRSAENPICIADSSVSRRHIVLRRLGAGWTVSDLGSGNGTLVNGEQISDETVLASGDVITMGDTEVTFTDLANATMDVPITPGPSRPRTGATGAVPGRGGAPARPDRARPARGGAAKPVDPAAARKKKIMVGALVGVLVVAGAGLVVLQMRQQAIAEIKEREALAAAERRKQLDAVFQDAKNMIREGKWTAAKERLIELQEMAPEMELQDYLGRAEKEIPNQAHIDAAQAALKDKKLAVAKAELDKVTEDTQMFDLVAKMRRELQDAVSAQAKEARTLLDNKQLDPAKAITDDLLAAFPDNRDAKLINEEATRLIKIRDTPVAPPPPPPTAPPWEQAVARFVDGDVTGAAALVNACMAKQAKCKDLLKDMTEFNGLYKRLEDLDAKGLARLLSLDKEISGARGPSKMAKVAGTRAANIFYKSASAAKAAGQYSRAVEYAKRTLQADPGHNGAQNILTELKAKAKDVFLQAYQLKDASPEDALPKFREVLAMTPPDDETHQKAKGWIEKLSR